MPDISDNLFVTGRTKVDMRGRRLGAVGKGRKSGFSLHKLPTPVLSVFAIMILIIAGLSFVVISPAWARPTTPSITSASSTTFTVESADSFTVTTTSPPGAVTLSETGTLPLGVTFVDNGNGTATLSGTPAPGTVNTYPVTFTATNATGSVTQSFTLTVAWPTMDLKIWDYEGTVIANNNTLDVSWDEDPSFWACLNEDNDPISLQLNASPGDMTMPGNKATLSTTSPWGGSRYCISGPLGNYVTSNGSSTDWETWRWFDSPSPITISATFGGDSYYPAITSDTVTLNMTGDDVSVSTGLASSYAYGQNINVTSLASCDGCSSMSPISESGTLPSDLNWTGSGFSGTADQIGSFSGTLTAIEYGSDSTVGNTGSANWSFTVAESPSDQAPSITSASSTNCISEITCLFAVTANGYPTPTFSETGSLPSGVTLSSAGVLSGTPAASTGGTYPITIMASNGISPNATQSFTLTVNQAPSIISTTSTVFVIGSTNSFTIEASGYPTPIFSETGTLPSGVTFVDNGNGTATLSGTPGANADNTYPIAITATNSAGTVNQSFTLAVDQAPSSGGGPSGDTATWELGFPNSLTVQVTGIPAPSLTYSVMSVPPGTPNGELPAGLTFTTSTDQGGSTAIISGIDTTSGTNGTYTITLTASNDAGSSVTPITLLVEPAVSLSIR